MGEAKDSKAKEATLAAAIKMMEDSKRTAVPAQQKGAISYNSWYHRHKHLIPAQHLKEIIWADFKARGMKEESTIEEFNKALALYGVKL